MVGHDGSLGYGDVRLRNRSPTKMHQCRNHSQQSLCPRVRRWPPNTFFVAITLQATMNANAAATFAAQSNPAGSEYSSGVVLVSKKVQLHGTHHNANALQPQTVAGLGPRWPLSADTVVYRLGFSGIRLLSSFGIFKSCTEFRCNGKATTTQRHCSAVPLR